MNEQRRQKLNQLTQRLQLKACGGDVLDIALTHPSYAFENPNKAQEHNQRLEFLGDAILDFIVAEYVYRAFPGKPEGELTKMRAAVVNEHTLAKRAKSFQLGEFLLLGRGEELSGGRERPSILADALESLIGAVYLDQGLAPTEEFVISLLKPDIEDVAHGNYGDYKTILQERVQKKDGQVLYNILSETGPDHNKRFVAGVFLKGQLLAQGEGRTKKEAEQAAAQLVLANWKEDKH
ncbi:MAG TPA: ribonuclease III [Candidatus Deferrimicrobium sp.]|nr:ribonuclease III [Candidatus Deferrimicrobium sp.]